MTALDLLNKLCLILVVLTSICFCYQIFYLLIPLTGKRKLPEKTALRRYAILIAARNEEAVLPHLLESIRAQDYPAELISAFVVADNCTDRTAEAAEKHGATVFTRSNRKLVGKGYAIAYLLDEIQKNIGLSQFDAFLIFDADNLLSVDYIQKINALPSVGYQAFCGYRNTKNFGMNWLTSGYGLWYLHESSHMNRSRMRIGCGCAVNGTGFGFTRQLLEQLGGWPFFTLTEDIEFNSWCATNGIKIGYCHDAVAFDEQPFSFRQSWRQRTRWVQGGLQVSMKYTGRLFGGMLRGGWKGYTCYELTTLSMWGFGLATLTGCLSLVLSVLTLPLPSAILTLLAAFCSAYLSLFAMGAWTLILEWRRIYATTAQKLCSVLTFPLFMMTFAPIALTALFRKFEWAPIDHTVAISSEELLTK